MRRMTDLAKELLEIAETLDAKGAAHGEFLYTCSLCKLSYQSPDCPHVAGARYTKGQCYIVAEPNPLGFGKVAYNQWTEREAELEAEVAYLSCGARLLAEAAWKCAKALLDAGGSEDDCPFEQVVAGPGDYLDLAGINEEDVAEKPLPKPGRRVSRAEALEISKQTLLQCEKERSDAANEDAAYGLDWDDWDAMLGLQEGEVTNG